jgi:uncharacterized membrane protein
MKPSLQAIVIGVLFVGAGAAHFKWPHMYEAIVPPYLPRAHELVLVSGAFEILGGLGVMLPATRTAAGWGLLVLLLAVFPANVYMATDATRFKSVAPAWGLWARLPLQFLLMWWIYRVCIAEG